MFAMSASAPRARGHSWPGGARRWPTRWRRAVATTHECGWSADATPLGDGQDACYLVGVAAGMALGILGPLEVRLEGGEPVALGGHRQRALLAILILHANEVVSTDRLIDRCG